MQKKKISIKLKVEFCPICSQKMDLCVTSHKNKPFIDNKFYTKMCFTCYNVPKISEQKYDENGYIKEELELEYCKKNLYKPEELLHEGSADSIQYAKKCYRSVKNLVIENDKKTITKTKPKLEFYII
jgi:hypothetical protein